MCHILQHIWGQLPYPDLKNPGKLFRKEDGYWTHVSSRNDTGFTRRELQHHVRSAGNGNFDQQPT